MSSSRSRATSSCSSRISRALGSSLMTALQRICLVRSAYLGEEGGAGPVRVSAAYLTLLSQLISTC